MVVYLVHFGSIFESRQRCMHWFQQTKIKPNVSLTTFCSIIFVYGFDILVVIWFDVLFAEINRFAQRGIWSHSCHALCFYFRCTMYISCFCPNDGNWKHFRPKDGLTMQCTPNRRLSVQISPLITIAYSCYFWCLLPSVSCFRLYYMLWRQQI